MEDGSIAYYFSLLVAPRFKERPRAALLFIITCCGLDVNCAADDNKRE